MKLTVTNLYVGSLSTNISVVSRLGKIVLEVIIPSTNFPFYIPFPYGITKKNVLVMKDDQIVDVTTVAVTDSNDMLIGIILYPQETGKYRIELYGVADYFTLKSYWFASISELSKTSTHSDSSSSSLPPQLTIPERIDVMKTSFIVPKLDPKSVSSSAKITAYAEPIVVRKGSYKSHPLSIQLSNVIHIESKPDNATSVSEQSYVKKVSENYVSTSSDLSRYLRFTDYQSEGVDLDAQFYGTRIGQQKGNSESSLQPNMSVKTIDQSHSIATIEDTKKFITQINSHNVSDNTVNYVNCESHSVSTDASLSRLLRSQPCWSTGADSTIVRLMNPKLFRLQIWDILYRKRKGLMVHDVNCVIDNQLPTHNRTNTSAFQQLNLYGGVRKKFISSTQTVIEIATQTGSRRV